MTQAPATLARGIVYQAPPLLDHKRPREDQNVRSKPVRPVAGILRRDPMNLIRFSETAPHHVVTSADARTLEVTRQNTFRICRPAHNHNCRHCHHSPAVSTIPEGKCHNVQVAEEGGG